MHGSFGRDPLYTWLDVEAIILRMRYAGKWPEGTAFHVFNDGLEIQVAGPDAGQRALEALRRWFGARFDDQTRTILLEPAGDRQRTLEVVMEEVPDLERSRPVVRPAFTHVTLLPDLPEESPFQPPPDLPGGSPPVIAFYSFKGGVGRTTHALAFVRALYQQFKPASGVVLLVDADLEAPGLTWWLQEQAGYWRVSFLDLLCLAQYDESPGYQDTLTLVSRHLREQVMAAETSLGRVTFFFLPAFRTVEQGMRLSVRPEHVVRVPGQEWLLANLLSDLGRELGVRAVVVDLRAGFSEVASPLLFDPRVRRVLVTTPARPSVMGTCSVLQQMRKLMPDLLNESAPDRDSAESLDPAVVISMVTAHNDPAVMEARTRLWEAYPGTLESTEAGVRGKLPTGTGDHVAEASTLFATEDLMSPPRLRIEETSFAEELLHLHDLEDAWEKLSGTSVLKAMQSLAQDWVPVAEERKPRRARGRAADRSTLRRRLAETAFEWVYAESGHATDFLRTGAWEQLARRFQGELPLAVIMGAKGAGKTFLFLHLLRLLTWDGFLSALRIRTDPAGSAEAPALVIPLLYPVSLEPPALEKVRACLDHAEASLGRPLRVDRDMVVNEIESLAKRTGTVSERRAAWVKLIARVLGIDIPGHHPERELQDVLRARGARVVITIDGLEEVFSNLPRDHDQQMALRALCQELPAVLAEIPGRRLGLIVFVRKDLVRAAIVQNFGQFEKLHQPYELRWNPEEALRLAVWMCQKAGIAGELGMDLGGYTLEDAPRHALEEALRPVWGYKLGSLSSREAVTANWVIAALSDFAGRLQPRDVVRFFWYAARRAQELPDYEQRLLQPAAVRYAIEPCSRDKIEEVQEETPWLKDVFEKFRKQEDRRIPFRAEDFGLTTEEVRLMKDIGVILEDENQLYMPEIYRHGLGFRLEKGARPRVLTLMKRAFGSR